jgi:hypothetical protein
MYIHKKFHITLVKKFEFVEKIQSIIRLILFEKFENF